MMDKQVQLLNLKIRLCEKKLQRESDGFIEFPEI